MQKLAYGLHESCLEEILKGGYVSTEMVCLYIFPDVSGAESVSLVVAGATLPLIYMQFGL